MENLTAKLFRAYNNEYGHYDKTYTAHEVAEIIPEGSHTCIQCGKTEDKPLALYAVKHKATGKLITGTDFRYPHHRQIISEYQPPLLFTDYDLLREIQHRNINMKRYTVVRVNVEVADG